MLTIHTVKRTDRLETISAQYGVPVCQIMRANGFRSVRDFANCRRLRIPKRCFCNRCGEEAKMGWLVYTVQPGDTLTDIALRHGVAPEFLSRVNGLDEAGDPVAGTNIGIPVVRGQARYRVREGETLQSIAQAHNMSERRLRRLSGLAPDADVCAGTRLILA